MVFDDPVDWDKATGVNSRAATQDAESHTGLGDPTRWGSTSSLLLTVGEQITKLGQVVRVQTEDGYPRNWAALGTLTLPTPMFLSPKEDLTWAAYLHLLIGVGQITVEHRVNLRAIMDLACSPADLATQANWYYPCGGNDIVIIPWILPGGLSASSIAAQVEVIINSDDFLPAQIGGDMVISPYSAGHGL